MNKVQLTKKLSIDENDVFMDNHYCVQILTQKKRSNWSSSSIKLSESNIKKLAKYKKIPVSYGGYSSNDNYQIYKLDLSSEENGNV